MIYLLVSIIGIVLLVVSVPNKYQSQKINHVKGDRKKENVINETKNQDNENFPRDISSDALCRNLGNTENSDLRAIPDETILKNTPEVSKKFPEESNKGSHQKQATLLLSLNGTNDAKGPDRSSPPDIAQLTRNKQIIEVPSLPSVSPSVVEKKDVKKQFLNLLGIDSYDEENVKSILIHNKNILNNSDENGNTLLHLAVLIPSIEMVKWLLQYGADPQLQNRENKKPFDLAHQKAMADIFDAYLNQIDDTIFNKKYYAIIPKNLFEYQFHGNIGAKISFKFTPQNTRIIFKIEKKNKFVLSFDLAPEKEENKFIFRKNKMPLIFDGIKMLNRKKKKIKNRDWFVSDLKIYRKKGKIFLGGSTHFIKEFAWELSDTAE